jgi:hypothetical protein
LNAYENLEVMTLDGSKNQDGNPKWEKKKLYRIPNTVVNYFINIQGIE